MAQRVDAGLSRHVGIGCRDDQTHEVVDAVIIGGFAKAPTQGFYRHAADL
ncbi:MAG TPA: hypothetical protein PLS63_05815 [Microthrixaceae bacterium]|nr:hypothetical protein [Microthrixaceae bacterium]